MYSGHRRAAAPAPAASWRRSRRRCAAEAPLEVSHPGEKLVERKERRPAGQAYERHLERRPRLAASHDVVERAREALEEARKVVDFGTRCELDDLADLLVGQVEQLPQGRPGASVAAPARLRAGADLRDDEVAQVMQDVPGDVRQIEPLLREALDDREARGCVARRRAPRPARAGPCGRPRRARGPRRPP